MSPAEALVTGRRIAKNQILSVTPVTPQNAATLYKKYSVKRFGA